MAMVRYIKCPTCKTERPTDHRYRWVGDGNGTPILEYHCRKIVQGIFAGCGRWFPYTGNSWDQTVIDIGPTEVVTLPLAPSVDLSRFPHICPRCGGKAYIGIITEHLESDKDAKCL